MKTTTIEVDNLKCGGCEGTVTKQLLKINGVDNVTVDATDGRVTIIYEGIDNETKFLETLSKLGYPKKGTSNSFQKAKSYVS
jgi:copper chaperone CopZ